MKEPDWKQEPPKSPWDAARRSALYLISDSETALARLRCKIAEHEEDATPDLQSVLRMMEDGRDAARVAGYIDAQFITFLDDTKQWPATAQQEA
jgi:hypothetical protein